MRARCAALIAIAPLLAGCGFHPLYATKEGVAPPGQSLAAIYVEPIPERVGYELRNDLLDLLNGSSRSEGARFRLRLSLHEFKEPVALQPNATITRYNYRLLAHYDLLPAADTVPVKSGDVSALSAYNVASSPYATVIAERDANDRAANDIAERIRLDLAVYFRQAPMPPP